MGVRDSFPCVVMRGVRSGERVAGIITRVDEELDASFAADCRAAGGDICRWRLLVVRARAAVGALLAAAHRQYGAGGPASCDATLETHIIEYYAGCAFYELRTHTHTR